MLLAPYGLALHTSQPAHYRPRSARSSPFSWPGIRPQRAATRRSRTDPFNPSQPLTAKAASVKTEELSVRPFPRQLKQVAPWSRFLWILT